MVRNSNEGGAIRLQRWYCSPQFNLPEKQVDQQELFDKLGQIEEHSRDALAAFPNLAQERLRMILALAKYIRSGLDQSAEGARTRLLTQGFPMAGNDSDRVSSLKS